MGQDRNVTFVIYHPHVGFFVDEGGAWNTDRDAARSFDTYEAAMRGIEAAVGNGLDPLVAESCRILEWW